MSDTFQPRGSLVFVRPSSREERTASGLIIPDVVEQDAPTSGVVVSCGPEVSEDVVPDALVLFGAYAATQIELDGQEIWSLRDRDIVAVKQRKD